jgi:hypothetical protein
MEIAITDFIKNEDLTNYCNSIANSGLQNIGEITWNNAKNQSDFIFVTEENKDKFIEYFDKFGAWDDLETWSLIELNGLFIQFVSGDWDEYEFYKKENDLESGPGNIYESGEQIYFDLA